MVNKIFIVLSILASFAIAGCLRTYYPVIHQTNASPFVFANEQKVNSQSGFLGADLTFSKGLHEDEFFNLFKVSYLNAHTSDYVNFNYQGFGYTGFYRVAGLSPNYDGNQSVIGIGTDYKLGTNFKWNKFKAGIGLNAGIGIEFGEYHDFRVNAARDGLIESNSSLVYGFFSIFPYLSYSINETMVLSTQVNVGIPGLFSPSIVMNSSGYIYWISWIPTKNLMNNFYDQRLNIGFMIELDKLLNNKQM